jgi:sugar phosphate isomerase/epimerase
MPDTDNRAPLQDRRTFLTTLGGAAIAASGIGALACVGNSTPQTPAAAASMIRQPTFGPVGVQLYTVRDEMQKDVAATLARVARIGYKEVEFAGYFNRTPADIRALLDADGLTSPSAHIPLQALRSNLQGTIDAAKVIGHQYITLPWLDEASRGTRVDNWRDLAHEMNTIGGKLRDQGLKLAYHHHDFEFNPVEGQIPYDVLLAETDPALVFMEMDLYWATKAGQSPLAYFAKYPGRIRMVHVKDSKGAPNHEMTSVGNGTIDWKTIIAHRTQAGIEHFFVEHDQPADSFASIEASYKYLSTL